MYNSLFRGVNRTKIYTRISQQIKHKVHYLYFTEFYVMLTIVRNLLKNLFFKWTINMSYKGIIIIIFRKTFDKLKWTLYSLAKLLISQHIVSCLKRAYTWSVLYGSREGNLWIINIIILKKRKQIQKSSVS